jgi:large subunit ribosomal protein L7/L12
MSYNNANINGMIELIKGMNAIDLMELVKAIEETFGVSAAMQMSAGAGVASNDDQAEVRAEKTEFKIVIKTVGSSAINVIKAIRVILPGLGLKEAKDLAVDGAVIKEGVNKEESEKIKKALLDAGASVDVV